MGVHAWVPVRLQRKMAHTTQVTGVTNAIEVLIRLCLVSDELAVVRTAGREGRGQGAGGRGQEVVEVGVKREMERGLRGPSSGMNEQRLPLKPYSPRVLL